MNQTSPLGLISSHGLISLLGVEIHVEAHDYSSLVRVRQRYVNQEPVPIEATYLFPLEDGAAIHEFNVYTRDDVYRGRVMEREEAFEAYDDAISDGHGAYLLDQERAHVFTASVGNLLSQQEVIIELIYVAQVPAEGEGARLSIPTVVAPRYVPSDTPRELGVDEDERWNDARWPRVSYGLDLTVRLTLSSGLAEVSSPSHPIHTRLGDSSAVVTLSQGEVALDRDVVIMYSPKRREASALLVTDERGDFVGVNFTPPAEEIHQSAEIICLLDCSGSMSGASIEQAKRSLALLLRGLEEGDTFNLYYFGSHHESLWERARPYTQENLDLALKDLERRDADLGGTELMTPLSEILRELSTRGHKRADERDDEKSHQESDAESERLGAAQLVLLTDGQVANERALVKLCEAHSLLVRIFTFGIGDGVSESLVRDLARVTNGSVEMVGSGERIEPKVLRMYRRLHQPHLTLTEIDWGGLSVERVTAHDHPLYLGDLFTLYAQLKGVESASAESSLKSLPAHITLRSGERSWEVPLRALSDVMATSEDAAPDAAPQVSRSPIPILWAREVIRELELATDDTKISPRRRARKREGAKDELISLAKTFSLMSSKTSFVAVEERSAEECRSSREPELRKIPLAQVSSQTYGGQMHAGLGRKSYMRYNMAPLSSAFSGAFGGSNVDSSSFFASPALAAPPPLSPAPSAPAFSAPPPLASPSPAPRHSAPKRKRSSARRELAPSSAPLYASPVGSTTMGDQTTADWSSQATDSQDVMFIYLSLQRADGSFEWSRRGRVADILSSEKLSELISEEMKRSTVFTTHYILWMLRTEHSAHSDLWARAEEKAERFLSAAEAMPAQWAEILETIKSA